MGELLSIMRKESGSQKRNRRGRNGSGLKKKVVVVVLSGALLAQPVAALLPGTWGQAWTGQAYASTNEVLTQKSSEMLTSGAKRIDYVYTTTRSGKTVKTDVHVIEVDLTNPYISLNAISGRNNSVGQRNNILNMTKENGAVGGINADVFVMASTNEGASLGGQIQNGVMMASPANGLQGMYAFAVTADKQPVIDLFKFQGTVTAENGASFPLEGINKSSYVPEDGSKSYSHVDSMFIYTSAWGGAERPRNSGTTPVEVLVVDGTVAQISEVGVPIAGAIPENGYILRAHRKAADFFKNLQVGQKVQTDYSLVSQTTGQSVDPSTFQMMVGGHTLLVDNGGFASFSRDVSGVSGNSYTSRSAVGYSRDKTKVYLITSERSGSNTGVSLKELQQIMIRLGVYKGVNLDGGGSTTMVDRSLGSFEVKLAHPVQEGSQRSVANGIGVFTSAPKGELRGLAVGGSNIMFLGQQAKYYVKGYDTYYNPVSVNTSALEWTSSAAVGTWSGDTFTATKVGKTTITAKSGSLKASYDVEVIGQDQIESVKVNPASAMLTPGNSFGVNFTVKLKNGNTYNLTGDSFKWEYIGFSGSYKDGQVTVKSVDAKATNGYAIARYDGFGVMVPLVKGETTVPVEDFEKAADITSTVTPADTTKGSVRIAADLPGQKSAKALQLSYDFTGGTGTQAAYAVFGKDGRTLSGTPTSLSMDVYSDNSGNWVRAEVVGADGKAYLLDVAKKLDWSGWKRVNIDLSAAGIPYPAKLKRIYVVTLDSSSPSRAASGSIGIDNIELRTLTAVQEAARPQVVMNVGKRTATVNGKAVTLDAAPVIVKESTYVPLRFVTEQMGAVIKYDNKTKRVTVLRGGQFLEMTIGKKEYTLNGVRYTSDVAPMIQGNRTLIPIRLFSEKLGFKVGYENKTKKITIE